MNISTVLAFGFEIFFALQSQEFSVGDWVFLWHLHFLTKVSLSPSNQSLSLSLFLQYSSWNTDRHIFVCCLTILHIPHTSWYSVLLSQSIWSTVTSYHLSKLTIFISVFRIFRQPVFSFFVCQFLNDQYQQHCTNNFLVIFLIDRWTERQTNKQTNKQLP